jgi:hypothetical protein
MPFQTGREAYPASCARSTASFPRKKWPDLGADHSALSAWLLMGLELSASALCFAWVCHGVTLFYQLTSCEVAVL